VGDQVGKQVQLKNNGLYPLSFTLECETKLAKKIFKVEPMEGTIEAGAVADINFNFEYNQN